jgi:predicted metal-binding membrane protein
MQTLPRRETIAIVASIIGITLLAWTYLILMAFDMHSMATMPLPFWNLQYFLMMLLMWAIMMVGMMLPSVLPTVLIYAAIARKAQKDDNGIASVSIFVSGYLVIWLAFSLLATGLQWYFDYLGLLSAMMKINNAIFAACLLILTGVYQCLPLKDACLQHCRSPVEFFRDHWRRGSIGAFTMGIHHGLFCLGCCALLMSLLFFGGVMSLVWIAGISVFVLLEKILPFGLLGAKMSGIFVILIGIILLVAIL